MALHEQANEENENERREKEDVAVNWVDSTDGLIFSVSTYLSIILPRDGKEKKRGRGREKIAVYNAFQWPKQFCPPPNMLKLFGPDPLTRNGNIIIK